MAVLNSWQKLSRVVSGRDFGDGSAGNITISGDPNSRATASGSSGSTALTIGSAVLSNGDVFMLHQTYGTGAGQWEINKVASGGGGTSITCSQNLQYTYGTGAQVIKIPLYDTVTLGSYSISNWDGSTGGIAVIAGKTSIAGSGTITGVGGNSTAASSTNTSSSPSGGGFRGGQATNSNGYQGEGTGGGGGISTAANGNGGGGGGSSADTQGGGGGNASTGGAGGAGNNATAGEAFGSADLITMSLGGGGGGGRSSGTGTDERSAGGAGGGIVILISESVDISSAQLNLNGGNAAGAWHDGGGGAGGCTLIVCRTGTLGTNKVNVSGGIGGDAGYNGTTKGGDGSVGRIAVHHSGTVTGTTSPTFDDTTDTLVNGQNNSVKASIILPNQTKVNSIKANIFKIYNQFVKAYIPTQKQINDIKANIKGTYYRKSYEYRIYDTSGNYIRTWSKEVLSSPQFRTIINGGPGELMIKLARDFDSFGEDDDIVLNYKVDLWVFDRDAPSGLLLYRGYISDYSPVIDGRNQRVDVTVLPYWSNLAYRLLKDSNGNTAVEYYSENPHLIFKDVIDKYVADIGSGEINYSGTSIDTTSTTVTYLFNANTVSEALQQTIELSPDDYYFRVDADGTVYYKQKSVTANHILLLGKNVSKLETHKRMENLRNIVYLVGGTPAGNQQLFRKYNRTSSIAAWGKREEKMVDQRITNTATADIKATRFLDQNDAPEIRANIRVLDNNGSDQYRGYDIESVKVGDTISIQNLKSSIKVETRWNVDQWNNSYWNYSISGVTADIMHIISISYTPDYIDIECARQFPEVSKRIEDIKRNLDDSITAELPTTPNVVT